MSLLPTAILGWMVITYVMGFMAVTYHGFRIVQEDENESMTNVLKIATLWPYYFRKI